LSTDTTPLQDHLNSLIQHCDILDITEREVALATTKHAILSLFASNLETHITLENDIWGFKKELLKMERKVENAKEGVARADMLERELNALKRYNVKIREDLNKEKLKKACHPVVVPDWNRPVLPIGTALRELQGERRMDKPEVVRMDRLEQELMAIRKVIEGTKEGVQQIGSHTIASAVPLFPSFQPSALPHKPNTELLENVMSSTHRVQRDPPTGPLASRMRDPPTQPRSQTPTISQVEYNRLQAQFTALSRVNGTLRADIARMESKSKKEMNVLPSKVAPAAATAMSKAQRKRLNKAKRDQEQIAVEAVVVSDLTGDTTATEGAGTTMD
jgi:hypothetical protein